MSYDPNQSIALGWGDTTSNPPSGRGKKFQWVEGTQRTWYTEDDYGANWGSFDPNTDLPSSPQGGQTVDRRNTNGTGGTLRTFKYDGYSSTWRYFDWSDGSVGTV